MHAANEGFRFCRCFQRRHGANISPTDEGAFTFPRQHRCAQAGLLRKIAQCRNRHIQKRRVQRIQLGVMHNHEPRHAARINIDIKPPAHARFPAAKPAICA